MGEAAAVLYACLPVTGMSPLHPNTLPSLGDTVSILTAVNAGGTSSSMHMLYRSTDYATPNIRDFVDRFKDVALPGTVILVKSGPFVFGGYAAESWIL